MTIKGQDWASYQSATPSTKGLSFVFIKATEGTNYVNPRMASQAKTARDAGLHVGFYHFVRPGDMKAQAAYFVEKCASVEYDSLWLDWEDTGVSCAQKDTFIKEVQRLRGSNHRVGLYCNTYFWLNRDTTSFCGDALWIADPNHPAGKPDIKHAWTIHQYSIVGSVDQDVANFATKADMLAWAKKGAKQPTEPTKPEVVVSTKSDAYKQVWDLDVATPPAGHATEENPTWAPMSILRGIYEKVEALEAKVAELEAKLSA